MTQYIFFITLFFSNRVFAAQEIMLRAYHGDTTAWKLTLTIIGKKCVLRGTGPDMPSKDAKSVSEKDCVVLKKLIHQIQPEFQNSKPKTPPILLVDEPQYEFRQMKQVLPVEFLPPEECKEDKKTLKKICKKNLLHPSNWLLLMMKAKAEKMKKDRTYREIKLE